MHTVHTPCVSVCGSAGLGPTPWTSDAHTFQICFRLKKNKKKIKKQNLFYFMKNINRKSFWYCKLIPSRIIFELVRHDLIAKAYS